MPERRHRRELLGVDVLAGNEELDRLHSLGTRSVDEILALTDEEPELLSLPRGRQPRDELQPAIRSSQ